ncbi:unnamed protein product, partial [Ceratitis capitata]
TDQQRISSNHMIGAKGLSSNFCERDETNARGGTGLWGAEDDDAATFARKIISRGFCASRLYNNNSNNNNLSSLLKVNELLRISVAVDTRISPFPTPGVPTFKMVVSAQLMTVYHGSDLDRSNLVTLSQKRGLLTTSNTYKAPG